MWHIVYLGRNNLEDVKQAAAECGYGKVFVGGSDLGYEDVRVVTGRDNFELDRSIDSACMAWNVGPIALRRIAIVGLLPKVLAHPRMQAEELRIVNPDLFTIRVLKNPDPPIAVRLDAGEIGELALTDRAISHLRQEAEASGRTLGEHVAHILEIRAQTLMESCACGWNRYYVPGAAICKCGKPIYNVDNSRA